MQRLGPPFDYRYNHIAVHACSVNQKPATCRRNKRHVTGYGQCPTVDPPQAGRKPAKGALSRRIVLQATYDSAGMHPILPVRDRFLSQTSYSSTDSRVICNDHHVSRERQEPLSHVPDQRYILWRRRQQEFVCAHTTTAATGNDQQCGFFPVN